MKKSNIPYHYTDLKKLKHKTWYFKDATGAEHVRLHDTCIIIKYNNVPELKLDSGGFKTKTTKSRINEFLPMFFESDWQIIQKKSIWYLRSEELDKEILFQDNMRLYFDNETNDYKPMNIKYVRNEKELTELRSDVKKYSQEFIKKFVNGEIKPPSEGDCWYCLGMFEDAGSSQHILAHLTKKYYVPALLYNSIFKNNMCGLSDIMKTFVSYKWKLVEVQDSLKPNVDKFLREDFVQDSLTKNLTKYLLRKLSMPI